MTRSNDNMETGGALPEAGGVARQVVPLDDGRTIAWVQAGEGRDLLALHGALVTLEDMTLGPVPALSQHFRVTTIDRPGHGRSERQRIVDASPWRQATIIHEFVRRLGLERPIVLGHSFGGAVALAYAVLYPDETAGVVALAPICFPEFRTETFLFGPRGVPYLGEALARTFGATTDKALMPLLWRAMYLPQTMPGNVKEEFPFALAGSTRQLIAEGEDSVGLLPSLFRLAAAFPSCKVPTRFLGGTADVVVNNAMQGRVAARLMPNASFEWFPGIGHMLHHFQQDEVVAAAVGLRDLPAGSSRSSNDASQVQGTG